MWLESPCCTAWRHAFAACRHALVAVLHAFVAGQRPRQTLPGLLQALQPAHQASGIEPPEHGPPVEPGPPGGLRPVLAGHHVHPRPVRSPELFEADLPRLGLRPQDPAARQAGALRTVRSAALHVRAEAVTVRAEAVTVRAEAVTVKSAALHARAEAVTVRSAALHARAEAVTGSAIRAGAAFAPDVLAPPRVAVASLALCAPATTTTRGRSAGRCEVIARYGRCSRRAR